MQQFKLALLQQAVSKNYQDNLNATAKNIAIAAKKGADLVLLSELHTLPYFCQTKDEKHFATAESIPGATSEYFSKIAKKHSIHIVVSVFEKASENQAGTGSDFYSFAVHMVHGDVPHRNRSIYRRKTICGKKQPGQRKTEKHDLNFIRLERVNSFLRWSVGTSISI